WSNPKRPSVTVLGDLFRFLSVSAAIFSVTRKRSFFMYRLLLLASVATIVAVLQDLLHQSVSIRGVLRCRKTPETPLIPLENTRVQLYEKRSAILGNALIVSNRTDKNGAFYLNGSTSRLLPISPLLHIESDCDGRSHNVKLPSLRTHITRSKAAKRTVNIGVIHL
ncbi:unnamed protein product, partial [Cylicocyclus nassatus]